MEGQINARRDHATQSESTPTSGAAVGKATQQTPADDAADASMFASAEWEAIAHLDADADADGAESEGVEADGPEHDGAELAAEADGGGSEGAELDGSDTEGARSASTGADGDEPDGDESAIALRSAEAPPVAEQAAAPATAAQAPAPAPAAAPAASATPIPDVPDAPQHRGRNERHLKKPRKKNMTAKTDKYNVRSIRSNPSAPKRPGPQKMYTVNGTGAERYIITRGKQTKVADTVPGGAKVALNVSTVTKLRVGKKNRDCVMCWFGVQGSAWIPIASLADNAKEKTEIRNAVNKLAKKWEPAVASTKGAKRLTFRAITDPIAKPDSYDRENYILGHQSGTGNNSEDYLLRNAPVAPGAAQQRYYYNICMNLPQNDAPPVAVDIANPGDHFFVPPGKTFRREICIYGKGRRDSNQLQTWVYGFVAKKSGGKLVPDTSRAGWVPLRTLKGALPSAKTPKK